MSAIPPFSARLKGAMKVAQLDQSGLARRLGASPGVVYGWMEEGILPAGKYMIKLPEVLGVSGHYLLTGTGPVQRPGEAPDVSRAFEAGWEAAGSAVRAAVDHALAMEAPERPTEGAGGDPAVAAQAARARTAMLRAAAPQPAEKKQKRTG